MAYDGLLFGDPNSNVGIRKRRERRFGGMRAHRAGYDATWLDIAKLCAPTLSRFLTGYAGNGSYNSLPKINFADTINAKIYDTRAVWASEVLGNGMYSGLQSPSRPWFRLRTADDDANEVQSVKLWLAEVTRRINELFSGTNFYTDTKNGYQELGLYGIECGFLERHWRWGMVVHPMTIGEAWFGAGDDLQVSSLYRRVDMSVEQHYERWYVEGRRTLPRRVVEAFDKGDYDQMFPVFHAVEPETVTDPDASREAFSSVYWSGVCEPSDKEDDATALLERRTFRSKPFYAPRWVTRSASEVYASTSPGLNVLGDVRQIQMETLRKQQASDFIVKPALAGPAILHNAHASLQPGRVTSMASGDKSQFFPIWEIDPQTISVLAESKQEVAKAIDRGFYVDLFQAITNMQGVQPRNMEEIARRYEEQLTQLGPVVERVNQEKLGVCVQRAYEILDSAGMLPPPPEEVVAAGGVVLEYISVLAQAMKRVGLGGVEQTFGFASTVASATGDMSIMDNLDADAAIQEYGDIVGLDPKIMRPKEDVEAIRAARQQQQQAAAAAEQAAQLAPAAKQGVEAAQLFYDTPALRDAMGV